MRPLARTLLLLSLVLVPLARAQETAPKVAPPIEQLFALRGNWKGTGSARAPSDARAMRCEARVSWSEALGGKFLRADLEMRFEGIAAPFVTRGYLGFDAERGRFVQVFASNDGVVDRGDVTRLADGSIAALRLTHAPAMPGAERALWKADQDRLTLTTEWFPETGPSVPMLKLELARDGEPYEADFGAPAFGKASPDANLVRLARLAGTYALAGTVTMAPGAPPMELTGRETFRAAFGGHVLVGTSTGSAQGFPGTYEAEVFWALDPVTGSIASAYATNLGEIGGSQSRFGADGRTLVSVHSGLRRGLPMSQRFVMELDEHGVLAGARGDTLLGDTPPFESFRARYTKQ